MIRFNKRKIIIFLIFLFCITSTFIVNAEVPIIRLGVPNLSAISQGNLSWNETRAGDWLNANRTNGDVGFSLDVSTGRTDPGAFLSYGGSSSERMLQVLHTSGSGILGASGSTGGHIWLGDAGGASDDKWFRIEVDAGIVEFDSLTDLGSGRVNNIMVMDMGTGAVGHGIIPETDFHISTSGVTDQYIGSTADSDTRLWFNGDSDNDGAGEIWSFIGMDYSTGLLKIGRSDNFATANHIVINETGLVGVGDNPDGNFDVHPATGNTEVFVGGDSNTGDARIWLKTDRDGDDDTSLIQHDDSINSLVLRTGTATSGGTGLIIDSSNNVGRNAPNPSHGFTNFGTQNQSGNMLIEGDLEVRDNLVSSVSEIKSCASTGATCWTITNDANTGIINQTNQNGLIMTYELDKDVVVLNKLGVGDTPAIELEISGTGEMIRLTDGATGDPKIALYQGANERFFIQYNDADDSTDFNADSHIDFLTNNAQAMRIDSAGNVGRNVLNPSHGFENFGTTNLSGDTQIEGTIYQTADTTYSSPNKEAGFRSKFVNVGGTTNDVGIGMGSSTQMWFNTHNAGNFTWYGGTDGVWMVLDGTGSDLNLGLNVNNPTFGFENFGTTNLSGNTIIDDVSNLSFNTEGGEYISSYSLGILGSSSRGNVNFFADNNNNDADTLQHFGWYTNDIMSSGKTPKMVLDGSGNLNLTGNITADYANFLGDTLIEGELDMSMNNITNLESLITQDGSNIRFGAPNPFSGFDQAISIVTNQTLDPGVITHALLDQQGEKVISAWQSGLNGSGHYSRNSMGIFPDYGLTNATILTNMREMWSRSGINPELSYFSAINETSLAVLFGIETQQLFLHNELGQGSLVGDGNFRWIGTPGSDIDLYEAPVHIKQDRVEEIGFDAGDEVVFVDEGFDNVNLGVFIAITSAAGPDEWSGQVDVNCPGGLGDSCVSAGPAGTVDKIMQTNFTTENVSLQNLTFDVVLTGCVGRCDFEVIANNNSGSGDVSLYNLVGSNIDDIITVPIPIGFDNVTLVSLDFVHSSTHPNLGEAFVDDVYWNGTATVSTLNNVTRGDGKLEFGTGNGNFGTDNIFYNGTSNVFEFSTNTTIGQVGKSGEIKIRDTDDAGWSCCTTLNGLMTCRICS